MEFIMRKLNKEDRLLIIEAIIELVEMLSDWDDNEEYINDFSHVSTGGGSCLEMLSGKKLPALEMLKK